MEDTEDWAMRLIPRKQHHEHSGSAIGERPQVVLRQMRREFDSLFDRFFDDWPMTFTDRLNLGWDFDIEDKANEIVVRAQAPGYDASDFNVEIVGNTLVLKAEHKMEHKREVKKGDCSKFRQQLYRSVSLPQGVGVEQVAALYHKGVIEVRIPKGERIKRKRSEAKSK
jgi:HSP20 family protein